MYLGDFENGLFMVIYVPINLKIEAGFRYDNFSNVKNYSSEILKTLKQKGAFQKNLKENKTIFRNVFLGKTCKTKKKKKNFYI